MTYSPESSLWEEWCRWVTEWRIRHGKPVPDWIKEKYPDLFPELGGAIIKGTETKE